MCIMKNQEIIKLSIKVKLVTVFKGDMKALFLIATTLEMGARWPYSCCIMGCYFQDLFSITCSILVQFPSSFFSIRLVRVNVVHPYSRIVMTAAWKKIAFYFIRLV